MSDLAPTPQPAAPAPAAPAEQTPPAAPETPETPAPGAAPEKSVEELLEANRKKNAEAKNLRDRNRSLEAELADFHAWKEAQKTDEQRAADRLQALEAENAELKRGALIARVKAATNLPDELVGRLRGDTEEELLEDAKSLAALVTPPAPAPPAPPAPNPGQGVTPDESGDPRQAAARAWLAQVRGATR